MSSRFVMPFANVGDGITPADGAKLQFYASGTSTPKDTYSDEDLTTANANPVIADADGVFGDIWMNDGDRYKVVLYDKNDVQQWESDPVIGGLLNGGAGLIYDTVADMKLASPLAGVFARTLGYYAAGDGGGAEYLVAASAAVDGYGDHTLANGTIALLQGKGPGNSYKYGAKGDNTTNDSAAIQAAIDKTGGVFFQAPGIYQINGITLDGNDLSIIAEAGARIVDTAILDGVSMFILAATTTIQRMNFQADFIQVDAGGGHIFDQQGSVNNSDISARHVDQNETGKRIWSNSENGYFFNKLIGKNWAITPTHTVSAIRHDSTSNLISANYFDIMRPDRSGSVPYMELICTSVSGFNYHNDIKLSNAEVISGGLLYLAGAFNTTIHSAHLFDTTLLTGHGIELDSSGGGNACKRTRIMNYQRNSGTLDTGIKDIMLTDADDTVIEQSGGTSGSTLAVFDLNSQTKAAVRDCEFYTLENFGANSVLSEYDTGLNTSGITLPRIAGSLVIADGAITVTGTFHRVDTQADASSDDLDTINGGVAGKVLVLQAENSAQTVVCKDGTGNLALAGDFSLDNRVDKLVLIYDDIDATWAELSRSSNAA